MELLDAAAALAAFAAPAVLVLRDVAAYDRPRPPAPAEPALDVPTEAAPMTVAPVLGVGRLPVAEPVAVAADVPAPEPAPVAVAEPAAVSEPVAVAVDVPAPEPAPAAVAEPPTEPLQVVARAPEPEPAVTVDSMLSGLTTTEADERSAVRRVASLVVLLTFTAGAAAAVAAVIYKGVSALG